MNIYEYMGDFDMTFQGHPRTKEWDKMTPRLHNFINSNY